MRARKRAQCFIVQWAGGAVVSQPFSSILTIVAFKYLSETAQGLEKREQQPATVGKLIFDMRRISSKVDSLEQLVSFHVAQAGDERAAADRIKSGE